MSYRVSGLPMADFAPLFALEAAALAARKAVRVQAQCAGPYIDTPPPCFDGRTLSLRGFDSAGMLRHALLAAPGAADAATRALFARDDIAYIHAHNAAPGCFAARIDRI